MPSSGKGRLEAGHCALLVCDVQERFTSLISGFDVVIDTCRRMVAGADALGIPILVTEQNPKALGATKEAIQAAFPTGVQAQSKLSFSMCEQGIEVHLVVDGISSQRLTDRQTALQRATQRGAFVGTSEMLLFQIMQGAKHPAFKAVSALFKERRVPMPLPGKL